MERQLQFVIELDALSPSGLEYSGKNNTGTHGKASACE